MRKSRKLNLACNGERPINLKYHYSFGLFLFHLNFETIIVKFLQDKQFKISQYSMLMTFKFQRGLLMTIIFSKCSADVPGRPGKPEATEMDKDHIKLKWASPISNGGSSILGYDVERRDKATGRWIKMNRDPVRVI